MGLLIQNIFSAGEIQPFERKTILVYDTSRGVAAEIRKKISKKYDVLCWVKKNDVQNFFIHDYFAAIAIVNDVDDLKIVENIKKRVKNLIVSTSLKKDYFDFPDANELEIFDLKMTRKMTITMIESKLKMFNFH